MAAQNYTIVLTDTGDKGSGPYTATMFLNPTTAASGGTQTTITLTQNGGFGGTNYTVKDIVKLYAHRIANLNAAFWDVDPEN